MDQDKELSLYSETEFDHRAPEGLSASCPTLDLTAAWDREGKNLYILRPPGQVVSKIHQVGAPGGKGPEVLTITWKHDGERTHPAPLCVIELCCTFRALLNGRHLYFLGQFLAVGWSDGFVRLMGLENNKAAHHIKICDGTEADIVHIGWARSSIASHGMSKASKRARRKLSEEWEGQKNNGRPLNLPRELTFLEIDTALPKISPLPTSSAGAG